MTTSYRPLVRTQVDLEGVWRHLMEPLGFSGRSLWLMFIDTDDRAMPALTEIKEMPPLPDDIAIDGLAQMLLHLPHQEGEGRWAFLLSRPGRDVPGDADREWAARLHAMGRGHGIAHDVIHVATDVAVFPVPLDDLRVGLRAS